jgi:signal transduction histidine kinase
MRNKIHKIVTVFLIIAFISSGNLPLSFSQNLVPARVGLNLVLQSQPLTPPVLRGIRVDPSNPFKFDFILDKGALNYDASAMREEAQKIIKYFLASLTIPEEDLWVNLSPYEKDRIVPGEFGNTTMGQEMLSQDYLLKQLAASLTYPETETGKAYWDEINNSNRSLSEPRPSIRPANGRNTQGAARIETTQSFNKVWIVPDKAIVYEDGLHAFIGTARFKVMTEEDYLAMEKNNLVIASVAKQSQSKIATVGNNLPRNDATNVFKTHILPAIEKEVNEGKNFAPLRQIYYSLILSVWFKKQLKETAIAAAYFNKKKIKGVDSSDENAVMRIYDQYLNAFKQGAYSIIQNSKVKSQNGGVKITRRTYFSGGVDATKTGESVAMFSGPIPVPGDFHRLVWVEGSAGYSTRMVKETSSEIDARINRLKALEISCGDHGPQSGSDIAIVQKYLRYFHYRGGNGLAIAEHARIPVAIRQVRMLSEVERKSRDYHTIADYTLPVTDYLRQRDFFHDMLNILTVIGLALMRLSTVTDDKQLPELLNKYSSLSLQFKTLEAIYSVKNFALTKREDAILMYAVMLDLMSCLSACRSVAVHIQQHFSKNFNSEVVKSLERIKSQIGELDGKLASVRELRLSATSLTVETDVKVGTSIMGIWSAIAKEKESVFRMKCRLDIDPDATVWARPVEMRLLWRNFLANTFKFAEIKKDLERKKEQINGKIYEPLVRITVKREGAYVVVVIADNGLGIADNGLAVDPDTGMPLIFHAGYSTSNTGGLGLDMALEAVRKLQGTIEVDREHTIAYAKDPEHSGAAFVIRLPASAPKAVTPEGGVRLKTDNITFVNKGNGSLVSRLPVGASVSVEGLAYNIERIKNIRSAEEFSRLMH